MRPSRLALVAFAFWGCRSSGPAPASHAPQSETPGLAAPLAAPTISAVPLALVASGPNLTVALVPDAIKGSRIRVASATFAAYADAGGPLIEDTAPLPMARAPFDPASETVTYAGPPPSLFAFRRKNVPCLAPDGATVLIFSGKGWREHPLRGRTVPPHAFLEWQGDALLIDSQIQACGWATSSPVERLVQPEGTVFTRVTRTGVIGHPSFGLDSTFMAWGASHAEATLTLVGTYGVRAADAPPSGSRDIVVMRRNGAEPFKASVILKVEGPASQSLRTRVREFGAAALLWPPPARDDGTPVTGALAEGGDELAWKGHASSIFRITDSGTTEVKFRSSSEQDCGVRDAAVVGDNVYAIVACSDGALRMVRAAAHGEPTRVALPSVPALGDCVPSMLIGRAPDDLWMLATCTSTGKSEMSAVFRRGHAQDPLQIR